MTHLKQAQDRLKVELEAQPHCSGFAAGANFILGILDEQEKHKECEHDYCGTFYRKCTKCGSMELVDMVESMCKPTPVPEELKWQEPAVATFSMNQIEENTRCISENIATIGKLLARSLQPRNL